VTPAGTSQSQLEWSTQCEVLANLRHLLINPLVDYGAADREHVFEAYAARGPVHARGAAAGALIAHAVRFLQSYGIDLPPPAAEFLIRPIAAGTLRRARPIGVFLQRRTVFEAVADALDVGCPGGACAIAIEGPHGSGLRTLRLATARAARLRGYVPLAPGSLRRFAWLGEQFIDRHVCVIADATAQPLNAAFAPDLTVLLTRLAAASARRHLVVSFTRPGLSAGRTVVHVDSMGVTAMASMVFVDGECGPSADDVFAAARGAEGRPGLCLARLGAHEYTFTRRRAMAVHESPQTYEIQRPSAEPALPSAPRSPAALGVGQRSIGRAESLARRGRHAAASRLLRRATRVLAAHGDTDHAAQAWLLLGSMARDRARLSAAIEHFDRARAQSVRPSLSLTATIGLGMTLIDMGRLIDADAALRTALVAAQALHDADVTASAATALARCLLWRGHAQDALTILRSAPETCAARVRVYAQAMQTRAFLAEGMIPSAVRSARSSVSLAESARDPRAIAAAYRGLAAAVSAAGDRESAAKHIAEAIRVATEAHLPLTVVRLHLAAADAHVPVIGRRPIERVLAHGQEWPPLLQFFARAVLARRTGEDLDAATRSFISTSGAIALTRPLAASPVNPVADLESFLELAHNASDERTALERITAELHARLRAITILVVSGTPERRVIALAGRPWHGDPHIAWRAIGGALSVPIDTTFEPAQAAEPLRYGGEVIAAVAARWAAGSTIDPERITSLLRVAALAMAASARALLDHGIPPVPAGTWDDLLGESPPARSLREAIARAARAPFPVLIQGESGSGKELVARAIHRLGARRDRRFCALNCAALSDELIEAELFGHARGAFTGAVGERPGLFEEADGGTLFLDEIGELSARAQAKLLRVLQDGEVRRVGENMSRRVDVRIVAATNRRLDEEAAAGRFRRDLRFRLDVVRIEVPPLRERAGDVPMLASRFWTDAAARVGSRATLAPDAVAALARYDWPGNVRELQNVIAWMAVHSPRRGRIGPSALPQHVAQGGVAVSGSFEAAKEEFERRFVKAALAAAGGQRARAAQALGITRQGLAKMMRRLRIE
jgi:DNA-binding NtrC family response regulator/tetratricopeptide (TPR) repeat protein